MTAHHSIFELPDSAKLAYNIMGSNHLGHTVPIVLICGMTSVWVDYERLAHSLLVTRPVLLYDHRGIGQSSLTPSGKEEITIDLLARDLAALLTHLKWTEVAICGYSMGGVVAQQMLVLPHSVKDAVILPFRTTHLFLVGTRSSVQLNIGLPISPLQNNASRTLEERKEIARGVISSLVDPRWIEDNGERFEFIFKRAVNPSINRPSDMIAKQALALRNFDFVELLSKLSVDIQVMVIHGRLDQVVPFTCAEEIIRRIPHARLVEIGNLPGQIPSCDFGHFWYEYFDIQVWRDVIDVFMGA
ncbi:hypothetical protein JR316_0003347 [Psilocybe cubensis]|uniref:AB hydrolase-1 domain-containing protein n=2 Tax=Psilocybe cubensis TaxID=181762 RepID=A0A8H8CN11_PSICU|nr:hypothetical protein JR316_0003347 [Psilocybe cubensis]KAH9483869.1 hypothetical protein JR316_0003347 [Psilocybe cubensis]